ncbi:hypothetical protein LCGC14_2782350 [marine sediment metagenome]|uniref:Uncharacterized protein n=1 Tax=marine sediment metagenome TaxID=412755 RepID=A0A0F9BJG9_9ZZZZ
MGKVAKPLTIVVFPPLGEWPEIEKLGKQGHTIIKNLSDPDEKPPTLGQIWELLSEADIIMGPRCWYMTELHRKHLTQAIKQARLRRYGTITKKRKKGDDDEKTEEHTDPSSTDPESSGC